MALTWEHLRNDQPTNTVSVHYLVIWPVLKYAAPFGPRDLHWWICLHHAF